MELDNIKGFIKRYSESYLYLSSIKSLSWLYIFLGLIPLGYGIVTRKFIVTSIVVTMVVFYTVITNILVRKMTSVSYYQRFLLTGSSSLFTSLFFLMMPYSLVETAIFDRMTQIIYSLVIGFAWILAVFLILSFEIYNTKKGKYSKAKSKKKNRAGIAVAASIGGVSGVSLMKLASNWMTQEIALNVGIILAFIVSVLAALGIPHFLVAYFVKKYSISGESLPVSLFSRKKMSTGKRKVLKIFITCLIIFVFVITIMAILGTLVDKGILK
ncbi:hypothetical protein IMSAG013_01622 [Clostridiales bacterium]|nr:hypothetical protein IMSAG013_01622 [Clostridiales bacterium]